MPLAYAPFDEFMSSEPKCEGGKKKKKRAQKDPICSLYEQQFNTGKMLDNDFLSLLDEDEMIQHASKDTQSPYKKFGPKTNVYQRVGARKHVQAEEHIEVSRPSRYCKQQQRAYPDRPSRHNVDNLDGWNWDDASNLYDLNETPLYDRFSSSAIEAEESYPEETPATRAPVPVYAEEEEDYSVEPSVSLPMRDEAYARLPIQSAYPPQRYVEPYRNGPDEPVQWADVALYVFSGIILIVMLEQILRIGLHFKGQN